jgi:hypothetical protein
LDYLFAAVRPATGDDFALVLPEVSTEAKRLRRTPGRFCGLRGCAAHPLIAYRSIDVVEERCRI